MAPSPQRQMTVTPEQVEPQSMGKGEFATGPQVPAQPKEDFPVEATVHDLPWLQQSHVPYGQQVTPEPKGPLGRAARELTIRPLREEPGGWIERHIPGFMKPEGLSIQERAKASNIMALSEATGGKIRPSEIEQMYEPLMEHIGLKPNPTSAEFLPKIAIAASTLLSGGGSLALGAVRTLLGVTGFMGTKEAESLVTQALSGEKPKLLKGRELKEFLGPLREPYATSVEAGELALPVWAAGKLAWRVKDWIGKQPAAKREEVIKLLEDNRKQGLTADEVAAKFKDPDVIEAEWKETRGEAPVSEAKPTVEPKGPKATPAPKEPAITLEELNAKPNMANYVLRRPQIHDEATLARAKEIKAEQKAPKKVAPKIEPEKAEIKPSEAIKEVSPVEETPT